MYLMALTHELETLNRQAAADIYIKVSWWILSGDVFFQSGFFKMLLSDGMSHSVLTEETSLYINVRPRQEAGLW